MKLAEALGAPLFNGNGWANTSLIQSEPLNSNQSLNNHKSHSKYSAHEKGISAQLGSRAFFAVWPLSS